MLYINQCTIEINNVKIQKDTLFKTKFLDNKVHLIEINSKTNDYITGGKYIIFNHKQVKSELFNKVFKVK